MMILLRLKAPTACAVLAAAIMLLAGCSGGTKHPAAQAPGTPGLAAVAETGTPRATTPTTPPATPTETPHDSPLARLIIPKIKVDAKIITLGIIASTNTMDSPKNKDDVGYYDFSPRPTYGGNTVLSAHVDWFTGQTGTFWDLKKLEKGDEVDLALQDGKVYKYKVTEAQLYDDASAPVEDIIGDTPAESVTMITCEGVFSPSAAEYDKRRVVRAERVYE
jgi:LPXTG-site transpeptidase (sortase) family protein